MAGGRPRPGHLPRQQLHAGVAWRQARPLDRLVRGVWWGEHESDRHSLGSRGVLAQGRDRGPSAGGRLRGRGLRDVERRGRGLPGLRPPCGRECCRRDERHGDRPGCQRQRRSDGRQQGQGYPLRRLLERAERAPGQRAQQRQHDRAWREAGDHGRSSEDRRYLAGGRVPRRAASTASTPVSSP